MSKKRTMCVFAVVALACMEVGPREPQVSHALPGGILWGSTAQAGEVTSVTEEQRLGELLFKDPTLSEPPGQACVSCHAPEHAFQGNNGSRIPAMALGSRPETFGKRNTPTIMYMAYSPPFGFYKEDEDGKPKIVAKGGQFWDGRADTLDAQPTGPLLNPLEMNNPSIEAVVAKVKAGSYADLVRKLYGPDIFADPKAAMAKLSSAIAAFESTPVFAPFSSKFDDYLRGKIELTKQEIAGFELFKSKTKGNCLACHAGKEDSNDPGDWIFTDFTYDALGAPRNASIPSNAAPGSYDLGLCEQPGLASRLPEGIALPSLCGAFKVPTLRNIAVTGPYFHNGSFASLRDAVAFYATRDTDPGHWYPKGKDGVVDKFNDLPEAHIANVNVEEVPYDRKPGETPRLDDGEVDALVAFLNTLTDAGMKP
jgi:cytochrome c peroxidase